MQNKALTREIQALVSIAAIVVRNSMDERLALYETGISGLQYGILRIIENGPQTITEISRAQMLNPSTLVPAVDALERNGLAQRTKDPKDRRRTPVSITQAGQALIKRVPMLDEDDPLVKGLSQMDAAHQEDLLDLLRELVGKLVGEERVVILTASIAAEMQQSE